MTRIMFDSTSPGDIPRDAEMVAYYVDGRYAWPQAWINMFPNAVKVPISAIGVATAPVGDVEVGCIWPPANAVPWVRRARADGYDPTIYMNELNDWPAVRQAFRDAGEPEPHYWTARYNGVRSIPDGAVARQFAHPHDGDGVANNPWETGKHYDLSVVADFWPGIDNEEDDLSESTVRNGNAGWLKEDLAEGTDQREKLQNLITTAKVTVKADDGSEWEDQLGSVVAAVDRRLARVEGAVLKTLELIAKVQMGGVPKAEIAKIAKDAIAEDLKNDEE